MENKEKMTRVKIDRAPPMASTHVLPLNPGDMQNLMRELACCLLLDMVAI